MWRPTAADGATGTTTGGVVTAIRSPDVAPAVRPTRERTATRGRPSHIAPDGFDFSKPYESPEPHPVAATPDIEKAHPGAHAEHPHKPRRVVAALLGGLGRK